MLFRRNSKAPVSGKRASSRKRSRVTPQRQIGILAFPAIVAVIIGYLALISLDDMFISIALGAATFVTVAAPLASFTDRPRRRNLE